MSDDARALRELAERAPLTEQREALRTYLARRDVSERAIEAVLRHTRDGITLWPGPPEARSRIGGDGILARGEPWPTAATGHPFMFVAALDFAELPRMPELPADGILALHWNAWWVEAPRDQAGDMDWVAATRAYYFAPTERTVLLEAPSDSPPVKPKPVRGVAMPIAGEPGKVVEQIDDAAERDALLAAMDDLVAVGLYPDHLLGAPIEIQGPVLDGMRHLFDPESQHLAEASVARYTPAERHDGDWMLLAQIEEQEDMVVADGGVLHFVILAGDLAARRFDRVVGVMESH